MLKFVNNTPVNKVVIYKFDDSDSMLDFEDKIFDNGDIIINKDHIYFGDGKTPLKYLFFRYEKVCLCGSTKFKEDFEKVAKELALEHECIITMPAVFEHSDHWFDDYVEKSNKDPKDIKQSLEDIHIQKINQCDSIFVINKGGYVGKSTLDEMIYAFKHHIKIRYLEEPIITLKEEDIDKNNNPYGFGFGYVMSTRNGRKYNLDDLYIRQLLAEREHSNNES